MKTAEEMFCDLGFNKVSTEYTGDNTIIYEKEVHSPNPLLIISLLVEFNIVTKMYQVWERQCHIYSGEAFEYRLPISKELDMAIHQQKKELGWWNDNE